MANLLKHPGNLKIDFAPSERQYELWNYLQPDHCPHCGSDGCIENIFSGYDREGHPQYKPRCKVCGTTNLPQTILGGGAAGGGKCLNINSLVCTPFGFRPLKQLKVGDIISNPTTGKQQRIVYIHPQGEFEFYRIHFVDGTSTECSEGHLWRAHQSRKKSKLSKYNPEHFAMYGDDRIWSTVDMYDWYQRKKDGAYKGCNLIIPLTAPVEFTTGGNKPCLIDPYILGALIGDGCIADTIIQSGCVRMTTMDDEIVQRFVDAGYQMDKWTQKPNNRSKDYSIYSKELIEALKQLGIAGNKSNNHFIPNRYKYAPIKDRIALMQGLMDTDGYVDDRGHMSYTTISKQLAEDVAFIVRSLGGVATITSDMGCYKTPAGEKKICQRVWTVFFRTKLGPELCGLTRKKKRARYEFNGGNSELGKRIIDIEKIGRQKSFCISVSDPSGLYIADDFTVTHNSYIGSCWLVSSCMRFENIRAVVARKTIKSLKESTFNTIKTVMKEWGLKEGENFKINMLEGVVTFWNDSVIILKELEDLPSDPNFERLGSSEYTIAFIDEVSEICEKAVEVLSSRIRWRIHETFKIPRLFMSTNPCMTWVRSRFVQDDDGNPVECSDTDVFVRFSLYDNPDIAFRQIYEANLNKIKDKATRERLKYGNWDFTETNVSAAYWNFDGEKHLVMNLREQVYNTLKPLIVVFDFNVIPYMGSLAVQIDYEKKSVYILEEILGKQEDKENNTPKLSAKVRDKYIKEKHLGGILVTGDPAGLARSTQTDDGTNNFTIIMNNMKNPTLKPELKLLRKQPPITTRLEFVNALFTGYDGWSILIDMRCRKLTEDLINQKKNADGTKNKARATDPKTKMKYEKYGHLSDCLDYVLCYFVNESWQKFQSGGGTGIETTDAIVYNSFEF